MPVRDVDAARNANLAGIGGQSFTRIHTAFGALAGKAPRHQIDLPFEECIEVGAGRGFQRGAGVAFGGGDDAPVLVDVYFR